ncbi:partner of Y14 and mago-like [Paramacrobiotus metropolitanus]|uniref:partner of Y14 and mago-like n=1 Tax=Paramacrobiotus metropolitanus TaxID=2943436 RepID=UPI0024462B8E|nr:partner of Y14 and mago-like [Paramacrobiotus metropolitanus]
MATGADSSGNIKPLQQYSKDPSGATIIPASKRADGTWRKPIRVKEGFVPQDEIPAYKTKQEIIRTNIPSGPFGLDPADAPAQADKVLSKSAKKRAKQKEKKAQEHSEDVAEHMQSLSISKNTKAS